MTLYYRTSVRREAPLSRESIWSVGWVPTTTVSSLRWTERNGNIRKNGDIHTVCPILVYSSSTSTRPRPLCCCRQRQVVAHHGLLFRGIPRQSHSNTGLSTTPLVGLGVVAGFRRSTIETMRLTPLTSISYTGGICRMLYYGTNGRYYIRYMRRYAGTLDIDYVERIREEAFLVKLSSVQDSTIS